MSAGYQIPPFAPNTKYLQQWIVYQDGENAIPKPRLIGGFVSPSSCYTSAVVADGTLPTQRTDIPQG